ncbi:MAG: hypothetical protein HQM06_14830 [Magnetococcales bacterium]|nr:hypothetical protein [Magnetococcales bacterium]
MRIDKSFLEKSLILTGELFDATPQCRSLLGEERFVTEFLPQLEQIRTNLAQGPNPDLLVPLLGALEWGFHSPLQATLETIIYANRFDWRFITGRRRPFKSLAPGAEVPATVLQLWQQTQQKAAQALAVYTTA